MGDRVALLDVNVLVALTWPNHVHHRSARSWFDGHHRRGWATTPITESGFVRVSSNRAVTTDDDHPGHRHRGPYSHARSRRPSVLDRRRALGTDGFGAATLVRSHWDVTDAHLLALAEARGGALVTLDTRMTRLLGDRDPGLMVVPA